MAEHAPSIIQQMLDARTTCRELATLLIEENAMLDKHDAGLAENRLQHKKRLSIRLEKLVQEIKAQQAAWRENAAAQRAATELAEEIGVFQQLASKNELLLRAAHQIRADIIIAIRDAVEARQPRVTTYGQNGTVTNGESGVRVMARDV